MRRKLWSFSPQTEGRTLRSRKSYIQCVSNLESLQTALDTCTPAHAHAREHPARPLCGQHNVPTSPVDQLTDLVPAQTLLAPPLRVLLSKPDSTSPPRSQGSGPRFSAQSFTWELIRNAKSQAPSLDPLSQNSHKTPRCPCAWSLSSAGWGAPLCVSLLNAGRSLAPRCSPSVRWPPGLLQQSLGEICPERGSGRGEEERDHLRGTLHLLPLLFSPQLPSVLPCLFSTQH